MNKIFMRSTILGHRKSRETGIVAPISRFKTLTGDFAWQDDAVECLSQPYSKLNSPTGSGKQIIISAAAAVHAFEQKQRALIAVPTLGLGNSYVRESIRRKSGKEYELIIPKYLDFRGTHDGYHDSTREALVEFLLYHPHGGIAVVTNQTLAGAWNLMKSRGSDLDGAFSNLWIGFDEAHHISGVLAEDEDIKDDQREALEHDRTYLGDICEHICNLPSNRHSGMSAITATHSRGDGIPMFYKNVDERLSKAQYVRPFIEHWKYLGFDAMNQQCIGYDNPIEALLKTLSPQDCSIVYLCASNKGYREDNPFFVDELQHALIKNRYRVLDLVTKSTQDENMRKLQGDNERYKAGADRGYDVILAVNLLREGTDYVAANHVHDLSPSSLIGRIVQSIGRMTRKDSRKTSIAYTAYFRNLHRHANNDEIRDHVSDRVNIAYAGMLGIFSLFDDTPQHIFASKNEQKKPETSVDPEVPSVFHLHEALLNAFGNLGREAKEAFICKLNDGKTVETAAVEVLREMRTKQWCGDTQAAKSALIGLAKFLNSTVSDDDSIFPVIVPPTMQAAASEIRKAGFDITKPLPALRGFLAAADQGEFTKLDEIVRTVISNASKQTRLAGDFRFGANKTKKAKKAFYKTRKKHELRKHGSAIAPRVSEP